MLLGPVSSHSQDRQCEYQTTKPVFICYVSNVDASHMYWLGGYPLKCLGHDTCLGGAGKLPPLKMKRLKKGNVGRIDLWGIRKGMDEF